MWYFYNMLASLNRNYKNYALCLTVRLLYSEIIFVINLYKNK